MTETQPNRPVVLAQNLTLRSGLRRPIVLRSPTVSWRRRADGRGQLTLSFSVSPRDYEQLAGAQIFSLYPELCGATFGGALRPDQPIEIEAGLAADLCAQLESESDAHAVAARLQAAAWNDPLRLAENYFAMYVKQALFPGVKRGFRTRWAREFSVSAESCTG